MKVSLWNRGTMWFGRWVWEHETMIYGGNVDINILRICVLMH